jgi:hypothetical protein
MATNAHATEELRGCGVSYAVCIVLNTQYVVKGKLVIRLCIYMCVRARARVCVC